MNAKGVIGIIGAMDSEIKHLTDVMQEKREAEYYDLVFYTGKIDGKRIIVVKSGIGKVNAARCTQILIDMFAPDAIINTGIAGAVASDLTVGDIVIGTGLVQHDFDATGLGYAKGYICTGTDPQKPTVFTPDDELVSRLERAAEKHASREHIKKGIIATGDMFVSSVEAKKSIWDTFKASAAEMEGGSIAQAASYSGVPFAVLRVMSDQADGKAANSVKNFEEVTATLSASIIESLIKEL